MKQGRSRWAQGIQGPKGDTGEPGPRGDTGATGATGATEADGSDGADGAPGADGVSGWEIVTVTSDRLDVANIPVLAMCPSGKRVTGGGASILNVNPWHYLKETRPLESGLGWTAMVGDVDSFLSSPDYELRVFAICASV